jgi:DNA replication protein DnaC
MTKPLETLWTELGLKTPLTEIEPREHKILTAFLEKEKHYRHQHKMERLLRCSGLKPPKTFAQFDWSFNPKLPKPDLLGFARSSWVEQAHNLVLIGDTGLGKSHLAQALCYEAILKGHPTLFASAFDLLSKIKQAANPAARIEYYARATVLCIDELGYTVHRKEDTDLLFQVISKRSEQRPTIVTTNLPPKDWGAIFSGPAASAILDRLSFHGKFISLEGRSYRLRLKIK